jgi:hypothetical protein
MFVSQLLSLNSKLSTLNFNHMTSGNRNSLFRINNYLTYVHVGRTGQQSGAEDNLLTSGQLAEMGKRRRLTIGTRVVEQRVDGADERVVAVV